MLEMAVQFFLYKTTHTHTHTHTDTDRHINVKQNKKKKMTKKNMCFPLLIFNFFLPCFFAVIKIIPYMHNIAIVKQKTKMKWIFFNLSSFIYPCVNKKKHVCISIHIVTRNSVCVYFKINIFFFCFILGQKHTYKLFNKTYKLTINQNKLKKTNKKNVITGMLCCV